MSRAEIAFQVDDIDIRKIRSEGISWDDVSGEIEQFASAISSKLDSVANKPKEIELEFGLSVGVEGGLVVVSGNANANIKVILKW